MEAKKIVFKAKEKYLHGSLNLLSGMLRMQDLKIDMHVMKGNTSLPSFFLPVYTSLQMAVKQISPWSPVEF
jgi:hypothetical protein